MAAFPPNQSAQAERFRSMLIQLDAATRKRKKNIGIFAKELDAANSKADDGREAQQMLECIHSWDLPFSIDIAEISLFHNCLSAYAHHIRELQQIGAMAGHYKPTYYKDNYRNAMLYAEQLAHLKALRAAAKSERDTAFLFHEIEVFGGNIGASVQTPEWVKLIHEATAQYFSNVRTTVKKIPLDAVFHISEQVLKNSPPIPVSLFSNLRGRKWRFFQQTAGIVL